MDSNKSPRERAEQFCEAWFDQGARASWCPKMVDELAAALAAPALGWTKERPTQPGYYWFRNAEDKKLDIVVIHTNSIDSRLYVTGLSTMGLYSMGMLHNWHGYWAGPIPTPLEVPR